MLLALCFISISPEVAWAANRNATLAADAGIGAARLEGTVSPWIAKARKLRPVEDDRTVTITAFLRWRNQSELTRLVDDVSTPGNPQYGQYLTPEQFHAAFSPSAQDVKRVQDALQALGFKIGYVPVSGLFVQASGTAAQVREAFQVSQDLYSYAGKTLRAHAEEPLLPESLVGLVTFIGGLDDSRLLMRPLHVSRFARPLASSDSPQPPPGLPNLYPCSRYWGETTATLISTAPPLPYGDMLPYGPCGYTPQQVRQAYGANQTDLTGQGVRIAITDLYASPTIVSDVNSYSANHGLPPLTSENFGQVLPQGVNDIPAGDPCGASGWLSEETVDVTAVHAMAPDASILYVAGACEGANEADGGVALAPLYEVIDRDMADIISNSWIYNGEADVAPGQFESDNAQFMQAAAEGITLLFASGDDGDLTMSFGNFEGPNPIASGGWPATSPYVTAVGGTSLLLKSPKGDKEEYGWANYLSTFSNPVISASGDTITEDGLTSPLAWSGGSGGGPSLHMHQPAYQKATVPKILATQTVTRTGKVVELGFAARVTPDISMLADSQEGLLVGETDTILFPPFDAGCLLFSQTTEYCEQPVGGTSLATPLLAGVLALAEEERFTHRRGPIGFVNPALYQMRVSEKQDDDAPILDVNAPSKPIAALGALLDVPNLVFLITIDSTIDSTGKIVENVDSSLRSRTGYDDVTGLGVPNVPAFIHDLGSDHR